MKNSQLIKKLNQHAQAFIDKSNELSEKFADSFLRNDFKSLKNIEYEVNKQKHEFTNKITGLCNVIHKLIRVKRDSLSRRSPLSDEALCEDRIGEGGKKK